MSDIRHETSLVRWLARALHRQGDCAIYRKSSINCYSGGKVVKIFAVPGVTQARTLWCDGSSQDATDKGIFGNPINEP